MTGKPDNWKNRCYFWWSRLTAMTIKELIAFGRDALLMVAVIYLFTFDIYLAGGVNMELKNGVIVTYDADHSAASRELIYLFRSPHFKQNGEILNEHEGNLLLDNGKSLLVLSIPPLFEHDITLGNQTGVQVQVDTSNTVLGTLAASYSTQIISQYGLDSTLKRMGLNSENLNNVPMISDQHRVWYNPNQKNSWFMTISELITVITMLAMALPASAAVREKEKGTIEQLVVTPLSPIQIMLPKVLSMAFVILLGTALSIGLVIKGIFHVPIKGSVPLFLAMVAIYTFAMSGLSLFISTISRNMVQAAMLIIMLLLPIILLSGIWTPPEAMPFGLRQAMYFSPLYYFLELGYGILLKGAGLDILWDSLLGLILIGMLMFGIGVWRFRRQFN